MTPEDQQKLEDLQAEIFGIRECCATLKTLHAAACDERDKLRKRVAELEAWFAAKQSPASTP